MARLEAVAQALYYPTPPEVVARLSRFLHVHGDRTGTVVRLLDPCAGTGAAIEALAAACGPHAVTYGIELHQGRAAAAAARLDHVLCEDLLQTRIANRQFSLLALNAPYDESGDAARRLEYRFLTWTTRVLAPGGLLVYLVPQRVLPLASRYLATKFTDVRCWRFPDPAFARFGQVVLVANRRTLDQTAPSAGAAVIASWAATDLPVLPEEPASDQDRWSVPALPPGAVLFARAGFDADAANEEAWRHGAWANPILRDALWPSPASGIRPLTPLRKGHLAILIAAGFLNNVVVRSAARRVLVKGRTVKTMRTIRDDEEQTVEREVLSTTITLLDLDTGVCTEVGSVPPPR